jgi:hypothetical protein
MLTNVKLRGIIVSNFNNDKFGRGAVIISNSIEYGNEAE